MVNNCTQIKMNNLEQKLRAFLANPTQEGIADKDLGENVLALTLIAKSSNQNALSLLSINHWKRLYRYSSFNIEGIAALAFQKIKVAVPNIDNLMEILPDSPSLELKELVLQEAMGRENKSVNDWAILYRIGDEDLKILSLQEMNKLEGTFEGWVSLHNGERNDDLDILCFQKMLERAKTAEHWIELWNSCVLYVNPKKQRKSILREIKIRKMSLGVLGKIYDSPWGDEDLKTLVLQKIKEREESFDDWKTFYDQLSGELRIIVLQKMREKAQTFEHWGLVRYHSDGKLKESAFQEMKKRAQNFDHWEIIWQYSSGKLREFVLQKMREKAQIFEHWRAIYYASSGELRKTALQMVNKLVEEKFDHWETIYYRSHEKGREVAFQKMLELLDKQ